jgi:hypothetical protein
MIFLPIYLTGREISEADLWEFQDVFAVEIIDPTAHTRVTLEYDSPNQMLDAMNALRNIL